MTPPTGKRGPLTDDELAWMKRRVEKACIPGAVSNWPERWAEAYIDDVTRLIAEVERLRAFLDDEAQKRYESEVYADWRAQQ